MAGSGSPIIGRVLGTPRASQLAQGAGMWGLFLREFGVIKGKNAETVKAPPGADVLSVAQWCSTHGYFAGGPGRRRSYGNTLAQYNQINCGGNLQLAAPLSASSTTMTVM
jgi:hypothetical protein